MTRITGTLHEYLYAFMMTSRWILLRMRNISEEFVQKSITHILCSIIFSDNRTVNEITWKNTVELYWPQMTMRRMRIACWITKATSTHSHYVILIAFPLQIWLHERASCYVIHTLSVLLVWRVTVAHNAVTWLDLVTTIKLGGDRGGTVVKVLCHKSEGRWFDPS